MIYMMYYAHYLHVKLAGMLIHNDRMREGLLLPGFSHDWYLIGAVHRAITRPLGRLNLTGTSLVIAPKKWEFVFLSGRISRS